LIYHLILEDPEEGRIWRVPLLMTLLPHYIIYEVFDILIVEKLEPSPGKKEWESLP